MTRWLSNIGQAVQALNAHRRRAALSILGITIGIAAVMAVGTISRGGNHLVFRELETFGLNSVWVFRNWNTQDPKLREKPGSGVTKDDFEQLNSNKKEFGIRNISPHVEAPYRWISKQGNREMNAQLIGVGRDFTTIANDKIIAGRTFNQNDIDTKQSVVLLGPQVVKNIIEPDTDPIGQSIYIDQKRFLVVGLLENKSRDFLASIGSEGGQNANDRILLPFTTLQKMRGTDDISGVHLQVEKFEEADAVAKKVRRQLLHSKSHTKWSCHHRHCVSIYFSAGWWYGHHECYGHCRHGTNQGNWCAKSHWRA